MNTTPAPTPTETESLAELRERSARHFHALLARMADRGAVVVDLYARRVEEETDLGTGPSPETAEAYSRVAQSVRRTVLLAQKLLDPAPAPKPAAAPAEPAAVREKIVRKVEDAIYRDGPAEEAESLRAELRERMDAPEFADDIAKRPVEEIIEEIARDLGVHGDLSLQFWKRRTPADVAALRAFAAAPGRAEMGGRVDAGALEDVVRPDGAMGCRDP